MPARENETMSDVQAWEIVGEDRGSVLLLKPLHVQFFLFFSLKNFGVNL